MDLGFVARCALEHDNAAVVRINKIIDLIRKCDHGIHDLSYVGLDPTTRLPRFNMPYELGLFMGCRVFGGGRHKKKNCLVLDKERYRYQKFISDLNGQDIREHRNDPEHLVTVVRNWLVGIASDRSRIPSGRFIWRRYQRFRESLPDICKGMGKDHKALMLVEYVEIVKNWRGQP
jgi:hypothetical protein